MMRWLKVRDRSSYLRMTGVMFLVFGAVGLTTPLFSNYVRSLGAETSQIGLVFAISQVASLSSQYWWGRRSDRLGRRKPLVLFGTGGIALAVALTALAPRYEMLFATRVLEGLAFAAYSTGSLALIGDLIEDQEQRGRLMGAYRMIGSLAFSGTALAGGLLADAFSLRVPLFVSAGCYALAWLLASGIRETSRTADERPVAAPASQSTPEATPMPAVNDQPADWRVLAPFLGLTFAWFFGMGSVVSLWPVFMNNQGFAQTQISGLWALAALGEVFWLFIAGLLADRIGRKWVIVTGVAGMACIYIGYTFAEALAVFIVIQMVRSFTYSCYETPALLYATELGLRKQRGRLAGMYYTASGLGGVAGSALGGVAAQALGMSTMFRGTAVVLLIAAAIAALVMPGRVRERALPSQQEASSAR